MSFSQSAKKEVLKNEFTDDLTAFAFLSGVIKGAGVLRVKNDNNSVIEILTELPFLHEAINKITTQYYGEEVKVKKNTDYLALKIIRYKIIIPTKIVNTLLNDISVARLDANNQVIKTSGIDKNIIQSDETKRAYIKGIFIATATSNIVIKSYDNLTKNSSGYHLEFVFNNEVLAQDFVELLQEFSIPSKISFRKNLPIVYIKEYQLICDVLALVGAPKAVLSLQNEAAIREVRNNVNRQTNLFNANLTKTVKSSLWQLEAISYIQETVGLESLEDPLMKLAILRIANPHESLVTLKELYNENISKSGINHRFEKIIKIAENLKKQHNEQDNN